MLIGPKAPEEEIAALAESAGDVPVIVADRRLTVPNVDAVRIDDTAAMCQLVGHLVDLGHREIWHASGAGYVSADPRLDGYLAAMAEHRLADRAHVVPCGGSAREGAAAAMRLLDAGRVPTAVVAYNDRVACGMIDVFWRNEVRVPEDISVVGFDNITEAVDAAHGHHHDRAAARGPDGRDRRPPPAPSRRRAGRRPAAAAPGPLIVRSSSGPPPLRAAAM